MGKNAGSGTVSNPAIAGTPSAKTAKAGARHARVALFFGGAAFLVLVFFLLNVCVGSVSIGVREVISIFAEKISGVDSRATHAIIVLRIRLPRALASLAGGSALAVAGLLLQSFFANPIVEPYVLGISSGSALFVGMVTLAGFTFGISRMTPMVIFAGAFIGAMAVMAIILIASSRVKSVITLLIIGMMAGYVCSAATSIMTAFAERERIAGFAMWSLGSFAGFTWPSVRVAYLIVFPFAVAAGTLAKPLNALAMGDNYAASMGIRVRGIRFALILISSVLTAAVTAFAGPVSFIGLAVPHICRMLLATSNNRLLIPACVLGGSVMAAGCDFIARNVFSPAEIPLGAVTAVVGAPIVVYLLARRLEG